jgi:antitoxin PrlF
MIVGRITAKSQTTVPKAVRSALGLKPGDALAYEIVAGRVEIKRMAPAQTDAHPFDNPFATFTEWADEADSAYDQLRYR